MNSKIQISLTQASISFVCLMLLIYNLVSKPVDSTGLRSIL